MNRPTVSEEMYGDRQNEEITVLVASDFLRADDEFEDPYLARIRESHERLRDLADDMAMIMGNPRR